MVEIDSDLQGNTITGRVSDLHFQQSYEDPKTGNVYLLPEQGNPKCVTVAEFEFNAPVETIVVEPSDCDPFGDGVTIGSSIGDIEAINCLGETVNLHQYCGAKAMWLVAVAGW